MRAITAGYEYPAAAMHFKMCYPIISGGGVMQLDIPAAAT